MCFFYQTYVHIAVLDYAGTILCLKTGEREIIYNNAIVGFEHKRSLYWTDVEFCLGDWKIHT